MDFQTYKNTGRVEKLNNNDNKYLDEELFPITHLKNYFFNSEEKTHGLSLKKKIPNSLKDFLNAKQLNQLPFPIKDKWVKSDKPIVEYDSFMIEIPEYTRNLMVALEDMGVKFIKTQSLNNLSDIDQDIPENIVVCCLGYGSKKFFSDKDMVAVRGQLILIKGQSRKENDHINYCQAGVGYMFPRRDAIILGGSYDMNETELTYLVKLIKKYTIST